jgi:uncharacterized Zn-finger protein
VTSQPQPCSGGAFLVRGQPAASEPTGAARWGLVCGMSSEQQPHKTGQYPKFQNDLAVAEIRIGAREFNCIGVSPPHDHPHVYLNMGNQDTILCPYCSTRFRFDPRLKPSEAIPPESVYMDISGGDLPPQE